MKKLLSTLVAAGLILSTQTSFAVPVKISEEPVNDAVYNTTIDEPTPEMMEEMIVRVRPLIDVPEEYTEFNWDFNNGHKYGYGSTWNFSWTDNVTGEIAVTCDEEGRIIGYNVYNYNRERKAVLPNVGPEELQPIAEEFIKKTSPFLKDVDLRLEEVSFPSVYYNQTYTYCFTRYENDIPVPENTVLVSINHVTKQVESYGCNMTLDIDFNKPKNIISADKAKEILSETQEMKLSYRMKTEYDDEGNVISRQAHLVYTPVLSYISVDAETGKVYTERNTWQAVEAPKFEASMGAANDALMKDDTTAEESEAERYQPTEQELAQIALLESLISKDEATKVILENKDLYIIENAYLSDARLTKRYNNILPLSENGEKQEQYVWSLYFLEPGETYLGMNAVVDAKTGELISYNADLPYTYHYEEFELEEPKMIYTEEQAVKIASEFIKKHQPEKFEKVVYSSCNDYSVYKYVENENGNNTPLYRANRLTFVRQNEGVDFTYNSFGIGVDRATGKITRYSYTWYDDVAFESPKDVIDAKDALMALYSNEGFGVNYEINANYTYVEGKYNSVNADIYSRAVYSDYAAVTTTIRALDGKPIDYNGEEIVFGESFGKYTDIENHWAKETIERFTWIGYGPEGNEFRPNDKISGQEFLELCNSVRIYGGYEEAEDLESLTRMQAVELLIDNLGYGKVAKLENVFITDFADNADFTPEDIGYAAIARGFGLIEGDGENFRPYDTLTRAEALTIIENAIDLGVLDN